MTLLLDTHAFLWFWWDDPQLSEPARWVICNPTNRKLISTASCWEVAIKVSLRKLDLGGPYRGFIHQHITRNISELLQIGDEHLVGVAELPFHHKDPFQTTSTVSRFDPIFRFSKRDTMCSRRISWRPLMSASVTVEEAQARLRELIVNLAPGEELVITEGQRPVAKIVGQGVPVRKPRRPGSAKGRLIILEEDEEHLEDFKEYMG